MDIPALREIAAERIQPGDVIWGVSQRNPRRGWLLDREPHTAESVETFKLDETADQIIVQAAEGGKYPYFIGEHYVLVEANLRRGRA